MIPEDDFETWRLIMTTVTDDIPSFNSMLPDLKRMMESIEKTNFLPGELNIYTDDFMDDTFPNVFSSILETTASMKIKEDNIDDVENISDFFKSSIKLCLLKITENSVFNVPEDELKKIISRKLKLIQLIYKLFEKIDLNQKPTEAEKVLNQIFLLYYLNDLNAFEKCLTVIDDINNTINENEIEEILGQKEKIVSYIFKVSSKALYSTTFQIKNYSDQCTNKTEFEKQKIVKYSNDINIILSKSFEVFRKISEKNLRKFDITLLDSLFETITKSIQFDFTIPKENNSFLQQNLLDSSYLNILFNCFTSSFFDKILYSLKVISSLCNKTTENYNNNKDYYELDEKQKKNKLKIFFVDKDVLLAPIIDNVNKLQNLPFNKEYGESLGDIYAFIIENKENIITIEYLKSLWSNIQFVFAADQASFYKIFEKITNVMKEKDCDELIEFILQQNKESINNDFLDFLYKIAFNLQKSKSKIPFLKIRDLFWDTSFQINKSDENEFARKKINYLCSFCSNEIIEKLINEKFQLIQDVKDDDKNKSTIEKENEFILKLCENSINKDKKEIRNDLCDKIVQFCISHLKDKNAIDLLTKVCTTQKVTLSKEHIEQLSNISNKFLTNILFSSGFEDDYIENLILSLTNIDYDLYELIEKYIKNNNKIWESIEYDYLTSLPFNKEDLLWVFSLKKSNVQGHFMNKLCEIYSNNDGFLLTDDQMIKHFLDKIEKELDKNENKENVFQLLQKFIHVVDETYPFLDDVNTHKPCKDNYVVISFQGIKKTFEYSKKNSCVVAYHQAAKELNVPLNQLTLIFDDAPIQLSKTFSQITYTRSSLELIPIVGDPSNRKIKHLRNISTTFQINRSNLMNKLVSFLSKDVKEKNEKKDLDSLMDLLNDLPTSKIIYSIINNFDKLSEINFAALFPTTHTYLFMYNLQVLQNMNEKIINEFVAKNGIEYFINSLTHIDSLNLISIIIDFLKQIFTKDEELINKYSNQLFESLMRICMYVSDIEQEKFIVFMKVLKPTIIPEFDKEFKLKFAQPKKKEEKEEKEKEKDYIDEFYERRRRIRERFSRRFLNDPFLDDDFFNERKYRERFELMERGRSRPKKEDKIVHVDNEMPFSHVITNVIAMTLIKKNVYVSPEKEIEDGELPMYLKNKAIESFEKLPIPSEYFEASFQYLTPSNYKDFMKAYSPHVLPPTNTAIKFMIENLDIQSSYFPFVIEYLKLAINDINDEEVRNKIYNFIFNKIFILDRDSSIDDDAFTNAMIIASNALPDVITNKINDLNVPEFDQYKINGKDYKLNKSKTGLKNLGCTCYFNSILQQFYHIPLFRKLIIEYNGNDQLLKEIGTLFSQMRESTLQFVSPKNVTDNWIGWDGSKLNPRIQEDASEYIMMFIDKISTIIPNSLFNGKMLSQIEGINDQYNKETIEPFYSLILPINQLNSLENCLKAFNSPTFFTNENKYYSDSLKKKIDAKQSDFIEQLPDHLILQLKRFEYDYSNGQRKKINSKVSISKNIDVASICKFKDNNIQPTTYHLAGVIQHMGSAIGGHYFSYVMERDSKMWYKCNDTEVTPVALDDVIENANGYDSNAYILFYDRNDIEEIDDSIINQNLSQKLESEKIICSNYSFYMTKGFIEFMNQISKRNELQDLAIKLILKVLPHANVDISNEYFDSLKEKLENDEEFSLKMQNGINDYKFLILNDLSSTNNLIVEKVINPMFSKSVSKRIIQLSIDTIDFAFERLPDSSFFYRVLYKIVETTINQKRELEKDISNNKNNIAELSEFLGLISEKTTKLMKTGIKEYVSSQKDLSPNYVMQSINLSVITRFYNIYEQIPQDYIESLKDFDFLRSLFASKNADVTYFMSNYIRARELQLFDVDSMLKSFYDKESIHLKMMPLFQSILMVFKENAFPMTWTLKFKFNDNYRTPQDIALCYTLLCKNGIEKDLLMSNLKDWVPPLILNENLDVRKMSSYPFRYLIPHSLFKKSFGEIPKYNDSYIYTSEFFNSVELQSKTTPEMKENVYKLIECLIYCLSEKREQIINDDFSSKISIPAEKYKGIQLLKLLKLCIKIFNDCDDKENSKHHIDYSKIIEFGEFLLTSGNSHPFDPHVVYVLKILKEKCTDHLLMESIPNESILTNTETISRISSDQLFSYMKIIEKIIDKKLSNSISLSEDFCNKLFSMILFNLKRLTPIIKYGKFIKPYNSIIQKICKNEDASKILIKYIDNNLETSVFEGFHSVIISLFWLKKKRPIAKYIHSYDFTPILSNTKLILVYLYCQITQVNGFENNDNDDKCYDTLFDDISNVFKALSEKFINDNIYINDRNIIWDYLINNTKKRINDCPMDKRLELKKELFGQFKDNYNFYYFNFIPETKEQQKEIVYITRFLIQFIDDDDDDDFNKIIIDYLIFLVKNSFDAMNDAFDILKNKIPEKLKDNEFISDVLSNETFGKNWESVEKFTDFAFQGKSNEDILSIFEKSKIENHLSNNLNNMNFLSEKDLKSNEIELAESNILQYKLIIKYDKDHFQKEKNNLPENFSSLDSVENTK